MPATAKPGRHGIQPVKQLLLEAGITQAAAAEAAGVTTQAITALCNGNAGASLQVAGRLARLLGQPIEDLFTPSMLGA